jgi:hypothetical protein
MRPQGLAKRTERVSHSSHRLNNRMTDHEM